MRIQTPGPDATHTLATSVRREAIEDREGRRPYACGPPVDQVEGGSSGTLQSQRAYSQARAVSKKNKAVRMFADA
jgi:hypothetical protein